MAYDGGRRLKLVNLVADILKKKLFFDDVKFQLPVSPPSLAERGVEAYLALGAETISGVTNSEVDSQFRLSVILFMRQNKNIDLWKLEIIDQAHEQIMSLQTDANFLAIASTIDVDTIDPGPLALQAYGLDLQIVPPSGVIRLDVRILLTYQAIA